MRLWVEAETGRETDAVARPVSLVILALIVAAGAIARLNPRGLAQSLWFDEMAGAAGIDPAHGIVYRTLMAALDHVSRSETVLRAPFVAAGVASIIVVYAIGAAIVNRSSGLVAAMLVAWAPVHVYYSEEARPYALLFVTYVLGLLSVIHLARARSWRWITVLFACLAVLVFTSPHGLPAVAALLLAWTLTAHAERPGKGLAGRLIAAAVFGALTTVIFVVMYLHVVPAYRGATVDLTIAGVLPLVRSLVSGHLEPFALPFWRYWAGPMALAGTVLLAWRAPRQAFIIALTTTVVFAAPLAALVGHHPFFHVRYVFLTLAGLAILAAIPIGSVVEIAAGLAGPTRRSLVAPAVLVVIGAGLSASQRDAIAAVYNTKADWRRAARIVTERARPGDLIVTATPWTTYCLNFYAERYFNARLNIIDAQDSVDRARDLVAARPFAFVVVGQPQPSPLRAWSEQFHPLWNHALEGIRIVFTPDRATYVTTRPSPAELARQLLFLWTSRGGRLDFGPNDDRFLLEGWGEAEQDRHGWFRWAVGRRSRLWLPMGGRRPGLSMHVTPLPGVTGQTLSLTLNGEPIESWPLHGGGQVLTLAAARLPWREGPNLITLDFGSTAMNRNDPRELAVLFRVLSLTSD